MLYGLNFTWHWSPITLTGLIVLCLLYFFGIWRVRRKHPQETPLQIRLVAAFIVAVLATALLLLTPLDTIARTQLFSAHRLQAVTLITLCAPLLIYACPAWLVQPLFRQPIVQPIARVLTQPVVASVLFTFNFLIWHAPVLFHLALRCGTLYHAQSLSFLLTSFLN